MRIRCFVQPLQIPEPGLLYCSQKLECTPYAGSVTSDLISMSICRFANVGITKAWQAGRGCTLDLSLPANALKKKFEEVGRVECWNEPSTRASMNAKHANAKHSILYAHDVGLGCTSHFRTFSPNTPKMRMYKLPASAR